MQLALFGSCSLFDKFSSESIIRELLSSKSLTSTVKVGLRELTTQSNFAFCAVINLVVSCALTWANQTSGSAGQNGGSLMLTAAMVVGSVAIGVGVQANVKKC